MSRKLEYRYRIGEKIIDEKRNITITERWVEQRKRGKNIVNIKYYNLVCNNCGKKLVRKEESSLYNHNAGCLSCKNQKPFIFSVGENIKNDLRDFIVLDRYRKIESCGHNRKSTKKYYSLKCNICGNIQEKSESNLVAGQGCCEKHYITPQGGYIIDIRPDLVPFFVDKDLPKQYGSGSSLETEFQCPVCGFKKIKTISYISQFGFSCPQCGDGFYYPQKFLYSVLKQLGINYISEYSPNWANGRRYDSFFTVDDKMIIVETDGGFHFEDNQMNGLTSEEAQNIDKEKDLIAKKHGINVIRIDCKVSAKEYIKNSIICSDFSSIFDLSNIDWDQCDIDASKSIFVEVCKYYDEHRNTTVEELCKLFNVSDLTIWKYLKKGKQYGLCPTYKTRYDIKDEKYHQAIYLFNKYPQMELKEIAKRIGRSKDTLTRYLKRGNKEGLIKYTPHPRKRM